MAKPMVTLSWSPEDAEEVAYALHAAALNKQGRVFDIGFEEDSRSIWKQIEAINAAREVHES